MDNGIAQALEGTTVVDLSQGIAGPYCAALLGEMGAQVIKVEPPAGDWLRRAGGRIGQSTAMFETFNRGKRAIVLDLKDAGDLRTARRLIDTADVVVENARVGAMQRLGLGYAELAGQRPSLVYTSVSGFGQTGPKATEPATDTVIQAYSGFARHATSMPGVPRMRLAVADIVSGIYASQATLAALLRRWRDGRGQWVRIDLTHAMAALQAYKIADVLANGPTGDAEAFALAGNYETRTGAVSISAASDAHVVAGLGALGLQALLGDARFADAPARQTHQVALREHAARALAELDADAALQRLRAAQVPCQRINDYIAFVEDAQRSLPGLFQTLRTSDGSALPGVRMPGSPAGHVLVRSPALGEHGAAIRAEFGLALNP